MVLCGRVVVLCCVVLCCVVLCCVVLCCVVLCCVALRCVALRCVALRCVALRCVALRCVVLCCVVCGVVCDTLKNPVCPLNTSPCVRSKRPRVYRHHAHTCCNMCARGAGTNGDVLNVHTETFFHL